MPRICYREKTFSADHQAIITTADAICDEYEAQGFKLTLRQLYYQFVARAIIENSQQSYKRLGSIVNDARIAGLLDWDAIEDRTRNLESLAWWDTPGDLLESCADQFKFDLWADQDHRVEVWIEKEALVGVIQPICDELRVPYFACRGYTSQSEAWAAGRRFLRYNGKNQKVIVLHLGDHDPSGIDMSRDNLERIQLFAEFGEVDLKRLALNRDQVDRYKPPPNPAKITDSRAEGYIATHGDQSWELDALEPRVIADLIRRNVKKYLDAELWRSSLAREEEAQERLRGAAEDFQT